MVSDSIIYDGMAVICMTRASFFSEKPFLRDLIRVQVRVRVRVRVQVGARKHH